MVSKRLKLSDELKADLSDMRKKLADISIDDAAQSRIVAAGCGGLCMITCSWHCESSCSDSCMGVAYRVCKLKQVCPGAPYYDL